MLTKWIPALLLGLLLPAWALRPAEPSVAPEASKGPITFEIFKDAKKEFRWKLKAGNGKILVVSNDSFASKSSAQSSIELIKEGAAKAPVEDNTKD